MYLHIGNGQTVKKKEIIGIFDMDTATVSSISKQYLSKKQKEKKVTYSGEDIPRSFLVLEKDGREKVFLSKISTSGLKLRLDSVISSLED